MCILMIKWHSDCFDLFMMSLFLTHLLILSVLVFLFFIRKIVSEMAVIFLVYWFFVRRKLLLWVILYLKVLWIDGIFMACCSRSKVWSLTLLVTYFLGWRECGPIVTIREHLKTLSPVHDIKGCTLNSLGHFLIISKNFRNFNL